MAADKVSFRLRRVADKIGPRRLVTIDFGAASTKVVCLSRQKGDIKWERAFLLPKLQDDYTFGDGRTLAGELKREKLADCYASIIVSTGGGIIRLLNFPGKRGDEAAMMEQVRQALGVDDKFSVQMQAIQAGPKEAPPAGQPVKEEYAVVASALPTAMVERLRELVTEAGLIPCSLRVSGVAVSNLAHQAKNLLQEGKATGMLEIGAVSALLLLFQGQELVLARQFKFGAGVIIDALKSGFELDNDTAAKLFVSGSFDFTANVTPVLAPWLHQLGISLDFFERRFSKTISALYVFGGGSQSKIVESIIGERVRRPLLRWNPLEGLAPDIMPPQGVDNAELFALAATDAMGMIKAGEQSNAV